MHILKWPQIHLRVSIFQNFPKGNAPYPLALDCALHNGIEHIPSSLNYPYSLLAVR